VPDHSTSEIAIANDSASRWAGNLPAKPLKMRVG